MCQIKKMQNRESKAWNVLNMLKSQRLPQWKLQASRASNKASQIMTSTNNQIMFNGSIGHFSKSLIKSIHVKIKVAFGY